MGNDLFERVALDIANELVDMGYKEAYGFAQEGNVDTFGRVVDGVRLQVEIQYFL